jgi:serine protease Do
MFKRLLAVSLITLSTCMTPPLLADGISAAEKVYQDVNNSIFMIFDIHNNDLQHPIDFGSAVAITKNVLATNCHVALKGDLRVIKIHDKIVTATLIYKDEIDDICLLKVPENNLIPVKLRDANSVRIGEEVFTVGSPKGYEKSISRGIISNKIKFKNTSILQTDAAISPGSSGGGLFDTDSNLIGITFLKNEASGSEGIGFALPTELISVLVEKLALNSDNKQQG